MKYTHVSVTWIVAILLHPLFMFLVFRNDMNGSVGELISIFIQLSLYGFVLAFPSLLVACLFMYFISKLPSDTTSKYLIWLFLTGSIPVLNFLFLSYMFFGDASLLGDFSFVMPSVLAVTTSILMRLQYFFKLFNNSETTE